MMKLTKFAIKQEGNENFYNFATNTWVKKLTFGCLSTFEKVLNLASKLKNVKIKKYSVERLDLDQATDIVLRY